MEKLEEIGFVENMSVIAQTVAEESSTLLPRGPKVPNIHLWHIYYYLHLHWYKIQNTKIQVT